MDSESPPTHPRALLGWRLLALAYDFFPALGLWFAVAAVFTLLHHDAVLGGWLGFAEFAVLWLVTGLYAVLSWRRGGATLGMRPWRLRVISKNGDSASSFALWKRYAMGLVSLLPAGAGFWWALFDRERLAWHDRASGTRLVRGER
jgi:uncharacterized RDD family membrane protein YckC